MSSRFAIMFDLADRSWPASRPALYDENLNRRADFGLGDVFGIHNAGDVIGTNGNAYYARIENPERPSPHPILEGFTDTNWLPGAQNRIPLKPVQNPVLTVVPGFVRYPPELPIRRFRTRMSRQLCCAKPARAAPPGFPGDIERSYWLTGHGDLLRLLHNTIRWITRDERIVHVEGDGFIEMFAWETTPGYAVHLLNYTNPNAQHGWMQSTYALGPQKVRMKLPQGVEVKSIELLRNGDQVSFSHERSDPAVHHSPSRRLRGRRHHCWLTDRNP